MFKQWEKIVCGIAMIDRQPPGLYVLAAVIDLALGRAADVADLAAQRDFVVRFQQTCGPVMAKAVEDTVFYRYLRLIGLNEVGGDPGRFGLALPEFHAFAERIATDWPLTMTTLSTHDTKRSEDVRARLAVLSERPAEWSAWVRKVWLMATAHRDEPVDPLTEYFLWQTVVGAWPMSPERLVGYATKAVREAKLHTAWVDGDAHYEAAVARWRQMDAHRSTQQAGRGGIFANYRLRVAAVVRDYGMHDREQAPADSRGVHG